MAAMTQEQINALRNQPGIISEAYLDAAQRQLDAENSANMATSIGVGTGVAPAISAGAPPPTGIATGFGSSTGVAPPVSGGMSPPTGMATGAGTEAEAPSLTPAFGSSDTSDMTEENAKVPPQSLPPAPVSPTMIKDTTTTMTRKMVDPSILAGMEQSTANTLGLLDAQGQAQAQLEIEKGKAAAGRADLLKQLKEDQDIHVLDQQTQYAKYREQREKLLKEYTDADIKPRGIFTDSLGQNILAGISIALGALGGSLSGSNQNVALNIINKSIERDIDAQKANLAKKEKNINMLALEYEAARQAGMDEMSAKKMATATALEQIAAYLDQTAANTNSALVSQNAQLMGEKVKQDALKLRADLTAATQTTATKSTTAAPPVAGARDRSDVVFSEDHLKKVKMSQGALRFADAVEEYRQLKDAGMIKDRGQEFLAKWGLGGDPDHMAYLTDLRTFAERVLRNETGATATDPEYQRIMRRLPAAGDTDVQFYGKLHSLRRDSTDFLTSTEKDYGLQAGDRIKGGFIWHGVPQTANTLKKKYGQTTSPVRQ